MTDQPEENQDQHPDDQGSDEGEENNDFNGRFLRYILQNIAINAGNTNNNQELIESLKERDILKGEEIENALSVVERGAFIPENQRNEAYVDSPIRLYKFNFNVSAPHMYALCLEALQVGRGQSFLDIGSGCGHMTALGGYLVGEHGKSIGWDLRQDIIDFSIRNLTNFVMRQRSKVAEGAENLDYLLHTVEYQVWNCFLPSDMTFDRIYVGASCPQGQLENLITLLEPGGIMTTPCGEEMLKITKNKNNSIEKEVLMRVRYGDLSVPSDVEIRSAQLKLDQRKKSTIIVPKSKISSDFSQLLESGYMSDFIILAGDDNTVKIPVHKAILGSRSEYFRAVFESGMQESQEGTLSIPTELSVSAVMVVLNEIYTGNGQDQLSNDNLIEVLEAASYFKIERLKAICERMLQEQGHIDVENSAFLLQVANRFGADQLKRVCLEFILKHFQEVKQTSSFKEMDKDLILEVTNLACSRLSQICRDILKLFHFTPFKWTGCGCCLV
eukprot:gb/GECH01005891.1/.p1 GENE.gb/GECH01005891.1/~~gb/GECH01005891.1/.p1  ORF type:complete len:500 (+),score=113.28 gb/GECH01005891.1/:1-1500(+)